MRYRNYTESSSFLKLNLHIHTFPEPKAMLAVSAATAEHVGRYPRGSHTSFSELYVIHALSELNPGPWNLISDRVVNGSSDVLRAIV